MNSASKPIYTNIGVRDNFFLLLINELCLFIIHIGKIELCITKKTLRMWYLML